MLIDRMIRAAKLDTTLFNEVMGDESATTQAILIIVVASLAAGLGAALGLLFIPLLGGFLGGWFLRYFITNWIMSLVSFFAWAYVAQFVGVRFFNARTLPYTSFLRPVGFAFAPEIAAVLSFIPVLGVLIGLAAGIWALVAVVIATREALAVSTGNAIAAALIAGIGVAIVFAILSRFLLPGFGAFGYF